MIVKRYYGTVVQYVMFDLQKIQYVYDLRNNTYVCTAFYDCQKVPYASYVKGQTEDGAGSAAASIKLLGYECMIKCL